MIIEIIIINHQKISNDKSKEGKRKYFANSITMVEQCYPKTIRDIGIIYMAPDTEGTIFPQTSEYLCRNLTEFN